MSEKMNRRNFLQIAGIGAAAAVMAPLTSTVAQSDNIMNAFKAGRKARFAVVGTGHRSTGFWIKAISENYADKVEFVALADHNPGRVETAKKMTGLACPTYTDFDKMLKEVKPDVLLVMTVDGTHDEFIIKALDAGVDVITEKPMTTDEKKCQAIIDAEKRSGRKILVGLNYRYAPHRSKIWELLREGKIGDITSVDFHWYLDTYHGADYFRRWHRLRSQGGSLLLHKASHHFDLLNYWIDSDPKEVFAYGALEFYGKNGPYRAENCRSCSHTGECKFFFDILKNPRLVKLYVDNEKHDGYLRDGCVFKNDIDIFDKMCLSIKYMNNVQVSYSLTTYSPYEGYRLAINGTKGRLDIWVQEKNPIFKADYEEIMITNNFGDREYYRVIDGPGGHAGGDDRMLKLLLTDAEDPMRQRATLRDGAFSVLVGIAARNSIDTGKPVEIASLTSIVPQAQKI